MHICFHLSFLAKKRFLLFFILLSKKLLKMSRANSGIQKSFSGLFVTAADVNSLVRRL